MDKRTAEQIEDIKKKLIAAGINRTYIFADNKESTQQAFCEEVERIFPNSTVKIESYKNGKIKAKVTIKR